MSPPPLWQRRYRETRVDELTNVPAAARRAQATTNTVEQAMTKPKRKPREPQTPMLSNNLPATTKRP